MTKSQIRQLSYEKLFSLSLKRGSLNRYTQEALYAQELLYTEINAKRKRYNRLVTISSICLLELAQDFR